jgi:FkbM family methyltransferase
VLFQPWGKIKGMRELLKSVIRPFRMPVRQMVLSGTLPSSVQAKMPYSWCEGEFPLTLDGVQFRYYGDLLDSMTQELFWTGLNHWEAETTTPFLKMLRKSSCFVDIGANTGVFSLLALASNPSCKVVAVEPVPHVYQMLIRNLELNGLNGGRCKPVLGAIAPVDGPVEFFVGEDTTTGSLTTGDVACTEGKRFTVQGYRGETLLADYSPDLMKIDVEGYEPEVLATMETTLVRSRPHIIFECNPGGRWSALLDFFTRFNFKVFHLKPGGLVLCDASHPLDRDYRNYLAIPNEKQGQLV